MADHTDPIPQSGAVQGRDQSAMLEVCGAFNAALSRVKKLGIPIYSIAQGEAFASATLSRGLKNIAQITGGVAYAVRKPKEVESVFADISEDLQHGYLLTYKPPATQGFGWRKIQLVLSDAKDCRVRSREG